MKAITAGGGIGGQIRRTEPAETWGPDSQWFAILPVVGGRCYCYATVDVPAGAAFEMTPRSCAWLSPTRTRRSVRCSDR